jgi:hypothetical protein
MNNDPTTYQITINLTGDDIDALSDILQKVYEFAAVAPLDGTNSFDPVELHRITCALAWHGLTAQRIARALDDAGDTAIVDNASDTAEPIPSPDFPDWND